MPQKIHRFSERLLNNSMCFKSPKYGDRWSPPSVINKTLECYNFDCCSHSWWRPRPLHNDYIAILATRVKANHPPNLAYSKFFIHFLRRGFWWCRQFPYEIYSYLCLFQRRGILLEQNVFVVVPSLEAYIQPIQNHNFQKLCLFLLDSVYISLRSLLTNGLSNCFTRRQHANI